MTTTGFSNLKKVEKHLRSQITALYLQSDNCINENKAGHFPGHRRPDAKGDFDFGCFAGDDPGSDSRQLCFIKTNYFKAYSNPYGMPASETRAIRQGNLL